MAGDQTRQQSITVQTSGPGLYEFTGAAARFVADAGAPTGLLTAFVRHTSCSLVIQENADPAVRADLEAFFRRLVPEGDRAFTHTLEGADDMPAHVKAALTAVSVSVPVAESRLVLGTWQGLFVFEHRRAPHSRQVVLHLSQ